MVEGKTEEATPLRNIKKTQEQYVKDVNSLADRPDYDHFRDVCWRHMEMGTVLQADTITFVKGFFRFSWEPEEASDLLDLIVEGVEKGHYNKFKDDGASFALSALPDSMQIHWGKVRKALLKAGLDGRG